MCDRTEEFQATVRALAKHINVPSTKPVTTNLTAGGDSQVLAAAQQIKYSLAEVVSHQQRLSELIHASGLFQDPSREIAQLSASSQQKLRRAATDVELLEGLVRDTMGYSSAGRSADMIIASLRQEVAELTRDLGQLLQSRARRLKQQQQRRDVFEGDTHTTSRIRRRTANTYATMVEQADASAQPQAYEQNQAQVLASPELKLNQLQSRHQAIEGIEQTVTALGSMYQSLVTQVQLQEEVAIRIDTTVEQAFDHVEAGHRNLQSLWKSVSGEQAFIIKVFAIILAVALFLIFTMRRS